MNPDSALDRDLFFKEVLKANIRRMIAGICATCGQRHQPSDLVNGECEACRKR